MSTTTRVALACVAGALIGTLVALEIEGAFWWVGLLVGAAVGYLGYDPEAIVRTMPIAWRAACATSSRTAAGTVRWFPGILAAASTLATTMLLATMVIILTITPETARPEAYRTLIHPITLGFVAACSMYAGWLIALECRPEGARRYHVFAVYFYFLPRAFYRAALGMPAFAGVVLVEMALEVSRIATIVGRLYREIHSDLRTMCAVDSAIGAAVGYLSGSPIIGTVAGLVFGVVNYKIVTQRILKIIPRS